MKSRHVVVSGSTVKVYCSVSCLEGVGTPDGLGTDGLGPGGLGPGGLGIEAVVAEREPPPRRKRWWVVAGFAVGSTFVALTYVTQCDDGISPAARQETFAIPPPPPPPATKPSAKPATPSPEELARRADEVLLRELAHDAWIHPLAGPKRRMPWAHIQAFGAARANNPPPECLSGHCGVDVGVDEPGIWGEPVHAVHDGTVSWVDRGPNEEYGGVFVKIAHRDGTLFSWYFHLAAVPRWVRPGAPVKVGQVIGLLGDTGLRDPVPHLHFSMSVKPPKATRERYIDPEPLIAIWPLWMPEQGKHVSTSAPPGLPVRGVDRPRTKAAPATPATPVAPPDAGVAEPAPSEATTN